jgi:RecG-like helicase
MDQSYAALVSPAATTREWEALVAGSRTAQSTEQARLVAVARTTDGFELAETDWELRREGDVLGLVQSGLPRLRVASLQDRGHQVLAKAAREHAERLLDDAGRLLHGHDALERELTAGWLARVHRAEPASAT